MWGCSSEQNSTTQTLLKNTSLSIGHVVHYRVGPKSGSVNLRSRTREPVQRYTTYPSGNPNLVSPRVQYKLSLFTRTYRKSLSKSYSNFFHHRTSSLKNNNNKQKKKITKSFVSKSYNWKTNKDKSLRLFSSGSNLWYLFETT